MSEFWRKIKASKGMRFFKIVSESASFALLLSIIFFAYEMIENMQDSKKLSENLVQIQNSLTTKHVGIFPNYLPEINDLFTNAVPGDSIVIFEDVLYYGFRSKPDDFKNYNRHLLELRNSGSHVIVAYYDTSELPFHQMVQENRFGSHLAAFQGERKIIFDSLKVMETRGLSVKREREDSIKESYLGKDIDEITFADFENMFRGVTTQIDALYRKYGFEMIPLHDYLTMSCWMTGDKIIFAFPSKYNTEEIGFSSQDPAFSKYVRTMLEGVRH